MPIPLVDDHLPGLMAFVRDLHDAVGRGDVADPNAVAGRVRAFFTAERVAQVETVVPGWAAMASSAGGRTQVHIVSALVALQQLPEFQAAPPDQQALAWWIVLFHDVGKTPLDGRRDYVHAFRSAVSAGKALPRVGFAVTGGYAEHVQTWAELTAGAFESRPDDGEPVQDNDKLPAILSGIDKLFGWQTAAALILQAVLLHMSITNLAQWPQAAPLTDAEIKRYVSVPLWPLLRMMMLTDNDAWHLFEPDIRRRYRAETLDVFARAGRLIGMPDGA